MYHSYIHHVYYQEKDTSNSSATRKLVELPCTVATKCKAIDQHEDRGTKSQNRNHSCRLDLATSPSAKHNVNPTKCHVFAQSKQNDSCTYMYTSWHFLYYISALITISLYTSVRIIEIVKCILDIVSSCTIDC